MSEIALDDSLESTFPNFFGGAQL